MRRVGVPDPPPLQTMKGNTMTRITAIALALAATVTLTACNTVNGAGKDMKSAGSAVSDASGKDKK